MPTLISMIYALVYTVQVAYMSKLLNTVSFLTISIIQYTQIEIQVYKYPQAIVLICGVAHLS